MRGAALAGLLLLAACGGAGTGTTTRDGGTGRLVPDPEGLGIAGEVLRIDFGRAREGVVAAVTKVLGRPPEKSATNPECGAGPLTIVSFDGIDLLFRGGDFRGWVADGPRMAAGNGLAPGVPRSRLEAAGYGPFRETSLGVEFEAGGIFGLLPDGGAENQVELIWAGTTCFFR